MATTEELLARISDLEGQLATKSNSERPHVARQQPYPESWPGLVYRAFGQLGQVWTSSLLGRSAIVTLALVAVGIAAMLFPPTHDLLLTKQVPVAPPAQTTTRSTVDSHPAPSIGGVPATEVGLRSIWIGDYTKEEDEPLESGIATAKTIKIMAYNADTLIQNMSPEFEAFFNRNGTSMQLLLANPDDAYYIQNTVLTLRRALTKGELSNYQKHFHDAVSRLTTLERDKGQQVEIRFFKNEMRVPIIVIDDHLCFLTLRLPPFESKQSLRMVFDAATHGFDSNCLTHFNQVWSLSQKSAKRLNQF